MQILSMVRTALTVLMVPLAAAIAQPPAGVSTGTAPRCGADYVRRFDMRAVAERTVAMRPDLARIARDDARRNRLQADPIRQGFWIADYSTQQFRQVEAIRFHAGSRARLWIDVADTGRAPVMSRVAAVIDALERATAVGSRDSTRGIIQNVSDVFGPIPTRFSDTVVDFLLFDIPQSSIAGYFSPWDQTTEMFSNQRNLLYIDSREGLSNTSSLLNTIAHEFQHLIHFGQNEYADIFLNEGCSEVAGLMCGYPDRSNVEYLRNTNWNLFDFPDDIADRTTAYERAFTLMWYLGEQFGERLLRAIPQSSGMGMPVLEEAMAAARGAGDSSTWGVVGKTFAVANYLQTSDNPRYGYRRRITNRLQPRARAARTYDPGAMPARDSITLQPYGAAYIVLDQPGLFRISFTGRYSYGAVALCYTGSAVEVVEFTPGMVHQIGSGAGYDRVVLVLSELSNATQKVVWTQEPVAGLDDARADAGVGVGLSIRPLPVGDRATVVVRLPRAAAVTVDLRALDGTHLRRLSDGMVREPGTHELRLDAAGLATGTYILSLRAGSDTYTQLVTIVR